MVAPRGRRYVSRKVGKRAPPVHRVSVSPDVGFHATIIVVSLTMFSQEVCAKLFDIGEDQVRCVA
jgi:hypothetical protein